MRVQRAGESTIGDNTGQIHFSRNEKRAVIRLIDAADHRGWDEWKTDMEQTLVHELLHIVLDLHDGEAERDAGNEERVVNALAKGLVYLRREGGRKC